MGAMDKEATFKVLDAFYEAGGRSIDTANNYQNEESETLVGDWLEDTKPTISERPGAQTMRATTRRAWCCPSRIR
jgi:aryl-alcohol dehydrogenase-like predicted oxidoreductase